MKKNSESGQIIVILAVALVAILGITALAVDGSMIYAERREDQSASDSTALSAAQTASAITTCVTARTAAINQAILYASSQEGVALVNDITSPNRVEANCNADNTKLTIKIVVTSNAPTTFAKMVSRNQLQTTVESVSQVSIGGSTAFANGAGLWSTGTTCDANGGIWLTGTAKVLITGGSAYSASCISVASSPSGIISDTVPIQYSGKTGSNVTTAYVGSQVEYLGNPGQFGSNGLMLANWQDAYVLYQAGSLVFPSSLYQYQVNPAINTLIPQDQWPIYVPTIPTLASPPVMVPPSCSGLIDYRTPASTSTIYNPGIYTSINVSPWADDTTMYSGVYCIKPGGNVALSQKNVYADGTIFYFQGAGSFNVGNGVQTVRMNNSSIYLTNGNFDVSNGTFIGNPISIYIKQGNFYLENGAYGATMSAPASGVLLYMDPANTGTYNVLNGNGTHTLSGTMYAPNALATFDGGTATRTNRFQLIAKRISMSGSAALTMDTNDGNLYSTNSASSVELIK